MPSKIKIVDFLSVPGTGDNLNISLVIKDFFNLTFNFTGYAQN